MDPPARAIGKDQFKLVEDFSIPVRGGPLLLSQLPIATESVEQIPVLAVDGGGEVGRHYADRVGRRIARAAGVGGKKLFGAKIRCPSAASSDFPSLAAFARAIALARANALKAGSS